MNLHGLVAGGIGVVNPFVTVTVSESTGYSTASDGKRTPTYAVFQAQAQIQALSGKDLRQIDGLNLNGTLRAIYFFGEVDAVVRALSKGGDVVTDSNANVYLVNQVLEQWPDWCKVVVTLQNGS